MLPTHHRYLLRGALFIALTIPAGLSRPALAQEAGAEGRVPAESIAQAKQFLRDGNKAFREGDFAAAEKAYRAAYAARPGYDTAGSLGEALLKLGRHAEAAKYLEECVRTLPATAAAPLRERMSQAYEEARANSAALRVHVNVRGAEVQIDGQQVGSSELEREIFVTPERHHVIARLGEKRAEASVSATKGSSQRVDLTIELERGPNLAIVIAGAATGLIGVTLGVTFATVSNGKGSDAEAVPLGSPERAILRDDQTLFGNLSFWSFVGAGVAVVGTTAYALSTGLGQPAPETASIGLRATPIVAAHAGGLLVEGRW